MITEQIEKLLRDDEHALAAAKKRLARCAEGSIHMKHGKGSYGFYHELPRSPKEPRREVFITRKKKRLITSLCTKKYCERLIPALQKEIVTLKTFLRKYDPQEKYNAFQNLPEEFSGYVTPIIQTNEQIAEDWVTESFDKNPFPLSNNTYLTKNGEYTRSRLEHISANMLYDRGIPYRYECALYLDDGSVTYPDFTILHPKTLELYWLELFGMMDDPDYAAAAFQKINRYAQAGILSKVIMIFDHRDAPFRVETLDAILKATFLE
ncbi:MAG: hypothetical protein II831_01985 [Firmicutes bacterium]|nr:hypothetical protein [Bacillota bacterium]